MQDRTEHSGERMARGRMGFEGETVDAAAIAWTPHPSFAGVRMKHLVRGERTEGRLSCHLVHVAPGCSLDAHTHAGQWELHEVVAGGGQVQVFGRRMDYAPGNVCVIPMGETHEVRAGEEGLWLLAKFFPALL